MRLLFIVYRDFMNPAAVGGDLYLWELAKGLSKIGNHVVLLCSSFDGSKSRENVEGVEIVRLRGSWSLPFKILNEYFLGLRGNFDLVIEEAIGGQRLPFFCSLYLKEPLVAVWHQKHSKIFKEQYSTIFGSFLTFLEFFQARLYRKRIIITPSRGAKQQIMSLGFKADNIKVVYDGIGKEFLDAKLNVNKEDLIVCLGKLRRYKRPDHAIMGFAGVLKTLKKPYMLVVAGKVSEIDKCYINELLQIAEKLGVSRFVNFKTNISEEEKLTLLKKARVLVQPSPVEGFSIVVIEANACGTPVVVSDGIPADVVINGRNGVVYPFGDLTALSLAISGLLSDELRWKRMSENGVLWAQNFNWEKSVTSLSLLLNQVLSSEVIHKLPRTLEESPEVELKSFYEKEGSIVKRYNSVNFWEKRYHQRKADLVLAALKTFVLKSSLVLDVGCGTGELSVSAENFGCNVVSLDISKSYLNRVSEQVENRICASSSCLPFRSSSFSIVLCTDVIEHLPAYESAINELFRISSNVIIITTPCNGLTRKLYGKFFPEKLSCLDKKVGHLQIWSLYGLTQRLRRTNWSVSSISIHVVQPILNNSFPRELAGVVSLIEKMGNFLFPREGTISLAIAINDNARLIKRTPVGYPRTE